MRHIALGTVLFLLLSAFPRNGAAAARGNYFTRIRANDAPVGGRFTIYGYLLDSLDVAVPSPGDPGRMLLLVFRDANGDGSFLVPGDLFLEDAKGRRYSEGFQPVGQTLISGALPKGEARYALWWVPTRKGRWQWDRPRELTLHYGFGRQSFYPLEEGEIDRVLALVPWDALAEVTVDPDRSVHRVDWKPDPAGFDKAPSIKIFKQPVYPESARRYDFKGTVRVVARLSETGTVEDVFVVQSGASHDLNIASLVAVSGWTFRPGRKEGRKVAGDILVPIRFDERSVR